jgi:competence protein ComEA
MTRNEFYLACFLVFLILVGVAYRDRVGGRSGIQPVLITGETKDDASSLAPAEIPPVTALVNINRAAPDELMAIPGIDRTCAENIVAFRQRYGRVSDLRELMEVSGIDRTRYERLRPYVRLADLEPLPTPASGPTEQTPVPSSMGLFAPLIEDGGKSAIRLPEIQRPGTVPPRLQPRRSAGPVNLNRATLADLEAVSGIGPVLAQRILEARDKQHGGFRSWQEVESVNGIGKARVEALRQHFFIPQR